MLNRARSARPFVASAVAVATASTMISVAPTAGAWETKYNKADDTCTVTFAPKEVDRINAAYAQLFTEMANATDNEQLKMSFLDAADDAYIAIGDGKPDNHVVDAEGNVAITLTPEEATKTGAVMYDVDIAKIALPYGVKGVIENVGPGEILKAIDTDEIAAHISVEDILSTVDITAAVAQSIKESPNYTGDGTEEDKEVLKAAVKDALKEIPVREIIGNADFGKINTKGLTNGIDMFRIARDILAGRGIDAKSLVPVVLNNLQKNNPELGSTIGEIVTEALEKSNIDVKDTVKQLVEDTGIDFKVVIKNIVSEPAFQEEIKDQLSAVPWKQIFENALEDSGKELSLETVLGYSVSDVTDAGKGALKNATTNVAGPIVTARDAFNACEPRAKGDDKKTVGSSGIRIDDDTAKGSVAPGSSKEQLKTAGIVAGVGLLVGILGLIGVGFNFRGVVDNLNNFFRSLSSK